MKVHSMAVYRGHEKRNEKITNGNDRTEKWWNEKLITWPH